MRAATAFRSPRPIEPASGEDQVPDRGGRWGEGEGEEVGQERGTGAREDTGGTEREEGEGIEEGTAHLGTVVQRRRRKRMRGLELGDTRE